MKKSRILFAILCITLLAVSCQNKKIVVRHLNEKRCMEFTTGEPMPFIDENRMQVDNEYSIELPEEGVLPPDIYQNLINITFNEYDDITLEEASEVFLNRTWIEDDEDYFGGFYDYKTIDSISISPYIYAKIESKCIIDNDLMTYVVNREGFTAYAAHGYFETNIQTIDLKNNKYVFLEDLFDVTNIGKVMLQALEEVESNRFFGNNADCLFDEYKDCLPLPDCFFISMNRSVITVIYNQYSVQPYSCGQLFIELPVSWLAKHVTFTPYGKKLLKD